MEITSLPTITPVKVVKTGNLLLIDGKGFRSLDEAVSYFGQQLKSITDREQRRSLCTETALLVQKWMQKNDEVVGKFMELVQEYGDYDRLKERRCRNVESDRKSGKKGRGKSKRGREKLARLLRLGVSKCCDTGGNNPSHIQGVQSQSQPRPVHTAHEAE